MLRARRSREAAAGGESAEERRVKRKRTLATTAPVAGEEELAARLFGRFEDVVESLREGEDASEEQHCATANEEQSDFFMDTDGAPSGREAAARDSAEEGEASAPARRPVWVDEDDAAVAVDIAAERRLRKLRKTEDEAEIGGADYEGRLRAQFERIHGRPQWAERPSEEAQRRSRKEKKGKAKGAEGGDASDEDAVAVELEAEALLRRAGPLLARRSVRLPSGRLRVTRVQDVNASAPSDAVVQAVRFHPTAPVALTAGLDKTLRLFALDGKKNPKIQSVHIPDLPMHEAHFTPDGKSIVCAGRRPFFYVYDIEGASVRKIPGVRGRTERSLEQFVVSPDGQHLCFTGQDGALLLVSLRTKQLVATLKMNGTARAAAFSADGTQLLSTGGDGHVYQWDTETQRCVHKFTDDGSTGSTAIAASHGGKFFATGSSAGVVNLYDASALKSPAPRPLKAFMNLTTTIDNLAFNTDDQVLGFSSKFKKDCFRLAHVSSLTVFANWPTASTPIHHANSFAFSPGGGFLSIGNDRGKALLYRVNHYDAY